MSEVSVAGLAHASCAGRRPHPTLADVGAVRQDYGGVENRTAPRLSILNLVRIDEELFNKNVQKCLGTSLNLWSTVSHLYLQKKPLGDNMAGYRQPAPLGNVIVNQNSDS